MKENNILLYAQQVVMEFPGVKALDHVDLKLRAGEVHAVMGENGAGKSTLIKCITGVYTMTEGSIELQGDSVLPKSTQEAQEFGISTVYQEVNLCANLSVAENIFIGREPMRFSCIDWKRMNVAARQVLKRFEIELDVTKSLHEYSIAIQQMVAIARAVDISAKVLILDEPTSSLDDHEVEQLFQIIRRLKEEGMAILFVSHFLDQIYAISDRMTILRNGKFIGEYLTEELPQVDLVEKMVGKELEDLSTIQRTHGNKSTEETPYLQTYEIGERGGVEEVTLEAYRGEVLGFVGLLGSGRTEVAEMLFGVRKITDGTMKLQGEPMNQHSPKHAIHQHIGFCPEDRKRNGIVGDLTIRENIILALQSGRGMRKLLARKEQEELADKYIKLLGIATPNAEKKIGELSGGNQQKVILARWLATNPELLILDEPTRGIDVGAKTDIQKLIIELCNQGKGIVFISSEIDEIIRCANRVVVMRDRVKVGEIMEEQITQESIIQHIAGGCADA